MNIKKIFSNDKKLQVIYRLEPGCLGPNGENHIKDFCKFAQNKAEGIDAEIIIWEFRSRNDKALAEIEYKINNKKLSFDKAKIYLEMFDRNIDDFEEVAHEKISNLIEDYFGNQ